MAGFRTIFPAHGEPGTGDRIQCFVTDSIVFLLGLSIENDTIVSGGMQSLFRKKEQKIAPGMEAV
jgi:hypothetical protein